MFGTILPIAGIAFLVAGVACLCFAKTRIAGVCLLLCGMPVWTLLGPGRDVVWSMSLGYPHCSTPLLRAVVGNDLKEVRKLLAEGADVDEEGECYGTQTPLQLAAGRGYVAVVKELLAAGAKVDAQALYEAAECCKDEAGAAQVARLLIAAGADVKGEGAFALFLAYWHPKVLDVLLEAGAPVDVRNSAGCTPLMHACEWGKLEAMERLIAAGADVRAVDNDGRSVLDHARGYSHSDWDIQPGWPRPEVVEGVIQRALGKGE